MSEFEEKLGEASRDHAYRPGPLTHQFASYVIDRKKAVSFAEGARWGREQTLAEARRKLEIAEDVTRKLMNEAQGFLSMADPMTHGVTNMQCLSQRIEEARDYLKAAEAKNLLQKEET